jgi:hypothetical protein
MEIRAIFISAKPVLQLNDLTLNYIIIILIIILINNFPLHANYYLLAITILFGMIALLCSFHILANALKLSKMEI